jgi:hypothetical protein
MVTLEATHFLDPDGSIIGSASLMGQAAWEKLQAGEDVRISLVGLKGLPSSYFNIVLLRLIEALGVDAVRHRVTFQFASAAQKQMFQRSYDAVAKSVA